MDTGKIVLVILAVIGVIALCATIYRTVWFSLITGNPMTFAVYTVALLLIGFFLGTARR